MNNNKKYTLNQLRNATATIIEQGTSAQRTIDLEGFKGFLYFLDEIFVQDYGDTVRAKKNPFWDYNNMSKRLELARDIRMITSNNIKGKFSIYNRIENGDKYGIVIQEQQQAKEQAKEYDQNEWEREFCTKNKDKTKYLSKFVELEDGGINLCKVYIAYELACHNVDYSVDAVVECVYRLWLDEFSIGIAELCLSVSSVIESAFKGKVDAFVNDYNAEYVLDMIESHLE